MTTQRRTLAFLRRNWVGVTYLVVFTASLAYTLYILHTGDEFEALLGLIGLVVLAAPLSLLTTRGSFSGDPIILVLSLEAMFNAVLLNGVARTLIGRRHRRSPLPERTPIR
jgi:hypothetical protein